MGVYIYVSRRKQRNMIDYTDYIESKARAAHEAVRAFSSALDEPHFLHTMLRPWDKLPLWLMQLNSDLAAHSLNERVTPVYFHPFWTAEMQNLGWRGGHMNERQKHHPNLVEFYKLPHTEITKMDIFIYVARKHLPQETA